MRVGHAPGSAAGCWHSGKADAPSVLPNPAHGERLCLGGKDSPKVTQKVSDKENPEVPVLSQTGNFQAPQTVLTGPRSTQVSSVLSDSPCLHGRTPFGVFPLHDITQLLICCQLSASREDPLLAGTETFGLGQCYTSAVLHSPGNSSIPSRQDLLRGSRPQHSNSDSFNVSTC